MELPSRAVRGLFAPIPAIRTGIILGTLQCLSRSSRISVNVRTLDNLIPSASIDFIKIDVEGSEREMLSGMARIIARSPSIRMVMEFNAGRVQSPADFIDEFIAAFPQARLRQGATTVAISRDAVLHAEQDVCFLI